MPGTLHRPVSGPARRRGLMLGVALLLLAAAPAGTARAQEPGSDLDPGVERSEVREWTGPLAVFAAVEDAWNRGDADALMELLDPDERIGLSLSQGGARGGWFNRDQAYFLLKDLLEFTRTERFEFEKYWNLETNGRSPYAVAVHSFRMNGGTSHQDRIYISLRRRDDQWFVGEIRSIGS